MSEVPISHWLWKKLEQKSHANNEALKKQLKKYIWVKKRKKKKSTLKGKKGGEESRKIIFYKLKCGGKKKKKINSCARGMFPTSHTTHCSQTVQYIHPNQLSFLVDKANNLWFTFPLLASEPFKPLLIQPSLPWARFLASASRNF